MSESTAVRPSIADAAKPERPALLGRLGSLETRLACNEAEIAAAQAVRYRVFCEEFSAEAAEYNRLHSRESDGHDVLCDHLLVESLSEIADGQIVGTQRFLLRCPGRPAAKLYSQAEYDVEALIGSNRDLVFMELGRSCILPEFRNKRTMELMWQGTWAYAVDNRVDVMIGCASFHTRDVTEIAPALAFLNHHAGLTRQWMVRATSPKSVRITELGAEPEDARKALRSLPPLIKGYLRLGAMFSGEAVPDPQFGTIDVLVVLPVERINPRYIRYYGPDASKHRD